jgi:hypothetical protein
VRTAINSFFATADLTKLSEAVATASTTVNHSLDWFKGKFTGNHGFYHQI